MVNVVVCPGCDFDYEDTSHALWSCPVLRPIWEANEFTKKILKYKFSSFADLLDMSFKFKEEMDLNLLTVLFWSIWKKRNTDRVRAVDQAFMTYGQGQCVFSRTLQMPKLLLVKRMFLFQPKGSGGSRQSPHITK